MEGLNTPELGIEQFISDMLELIWVFDVSGSSKIWRQKNTNASKILSLIEPKNENVWMKLNNEKSVCLYCGSLQKDSIIKLYVIRLIYPSGNNNGIRVMHVPKYILYIMAQLDGLFFISINEAGKWMHEFPFVVKYLVYLHALKSNSELV